MNRTLFFSYLLVLSACGPQKHYEGPELPDTEVGMVRAIRKTPYGISELQTRVGPYGCYERGIILLPGSYRVTAEPTVFGERKNCRTSIAVDDSARANCERDRAEAQRRDDWFSRDCSAEGIKNVTHCDKDFFSHYCEGDIKVFAGRRATITADFVGEQLEGKSKIELKVNYEIIAPINEERQLSAKLPHAASIECTMTNSGTINSTY